MIRNSIVDECNSSSFWSVMADETTDVSTKEQVSVCVRYIRKTYPHGLEVCEEFLGFCTVSVANAEAITSAIIGLVEGAGLSMDQLVGKGFDGASTMSGHVSGVSVRLRNLYPKAKYFTHCRNHALNLVLIAGCNNVPVYGGEEVIATNVLIGIAFAQFFGLVLYKIQLAFGLRDKVRRLKFRLPWRREVALENSNKWERSPILGREDSDDEEETINSLENSIVYT